MWAILFNSISVFPLKGRAKANEEKRMDFKNRDRKTPSSLYFRGVRGNREQFQNKEQGGSRLHPQRRSGHLQRRSGHATGGPWVVFEFKSGMGALRWARGFKVLVGSSEGEAVWQGVCEFPFQCVCVCGGGGQSNVVVCRIRVKGTEGCHCI